MDIKQIKEAIKVIAEEKGLTLEEIQDTLNTALAAAYRKDFGEKNQNIMFDFDMETGAMKVWDEKTVVDFPEEFLEQIRENGVEKKWVQGMTLGEDEEPEQREDRRGHVVEVEEDEDEAKLRYNPKTDILLEEAQKIKKSYKVGDVITTDLEVPTDFGRMAAQTAKQVIIQKLREAEREKVYQDFIDKEGELINAFVSRRDGRNVIIELGKTTAVMTPDQQVRNEQYFPGDRIKVYVAAVEKDARGPRIVVSRSHPQIIAKLFATEIPEIDQGDIEIKAIAREAGMRSKVAVFTDDESIDPIGSCVGQRGARIQTIIAELGGEKIDIIEWDEDPVTYIAHALSPAKVTSVDVVKAADENGEGGEATVTVPEDQLSLAIGKEGQNVRLAAKLTGWKINIMNESGEMVQKPAHEEKRDEKAPTEVADLDETHEEAAPVIADEADEKIEVHTDAEVAAEGSGTPDDEQAPADEEATA